MAFQWDAIDVAPSVLWWMGEGGVTGLKSNAWWVGVRMGFVRADVGGGMSSVGVGVGVGVGVRGCVGCAHRDPDDDRFGLAVIVHRREGGDGRFI